MGRAAESHLEDRQVNAAEPYINPKQHLRDELMRLTMRIGAAMQGRAPRQTAGPLDGFKGLVISDEEAAELLRDLAYEPAPETAADLSAWRDAIAGADARVRERLAATSHETALPLPRLASIFNLSPFEQQCLVLALAPEVDARYEKIYGYLQDDVTRRHASAGLALDLLCESEDDAYAMRAAFDPRSPLLAHRLCTLNGADGSSLSRLLSVDARVAAFLLGSRDLDASLSGAARLAVPGPRSTVFVDPALVERIFQFVSAQRRPSATAPRAILQLRARPDAGTLPLADTVCRRLSLNLVVADLAALPDEAAAFEESIRRIAREALLQPAALYFEGVDALLDDPAKHRQRLDALLDAIDLYSPVTFVDARGAWHVRPRPGGPAFVVVDVPLPNAADSVTLWEGYLARETNVAAGVTAAALGARFRIGSAGMQEALVSARHLAAWRAPGSPQITFDDVNAACRALNTPRLSSLARKIAADERWDDLILPPPQIAQLQEMCAHARYRSVVFDDWGFARKMPLGRGLSALFTGPPGTGKTMAARVIAAELQLDLYQIDLSQVVSKYIGETEKNLRKVFDEAEASHAVLFFDEADALFGKRSEVKDAHDRYANIEIGYLLQRMEEYEGVAILATNLRQNLDDAFVRRLRFIVDFPFPDEAQRREIWEVTLPRETPLDEDVDLALLAREIQLPGGNIRNIALAAAFAAAAGGTSVCMAHLVEAAQREHQKLGRHWDLPGTATA